MATKESIQRRELVAREILAASLERLGTALGLDLPTPAAEAATDPAFRSMTHLESLASLMQRVADEAEAKLGEVVENMRSEPSGASLAGDAAEIAPSGPENGSAALAEPKRPGRPCKKG